MGLLFLLNDRYLSYILIAFFDVFCGTNNQLMNTVYICFLCTHREMDTEFRYNLTSRYNALEWQGERTEGKPAHLLQDFLSKDLLQSRDLHYLPLDLPAAHKRKAWTFWIKIVCRNVFCHMSAREKGRWHSDTYFHFKTVSGFCHSSPVNNLTLHITDSW